jgi:hypothetical protein
MSCRDDYTPPSMRLGLDVGWGDIQPSEELSWVPCSQASLRRQDDGIDEFFCARLTVPMDYSRPLNRSADNPKVHIALVMVPGQGHPSFGNWSDSPLLVNPGGPGGEGTAFVGVAGRILQRAVGVHHDIVGFDPRGIGATTPPADCFLPTTSAEVPSRHVRKAALVRRLTWVVGGLETGLANTSDTAISKTALRARAMGRLCHVSDGENSILRYAGTPHVAQDMLSIVQAWDRWISANKSNLSPSPSPSPPMGKAQTVAAATESGEPGVSEATMPSTRGKLVYWGFSYGTVLGATFAAMFRESSPGTNLSCVAQRLTIL